MEIFKIEKIDLSKIKFNIVLLVCLTFAFISFIKGIVVITESYLEKEKMELKLVKNTDKVLKLNNSKYLTKTEWYNKGFQIRYVVVLISLIFSLIVLLVLRYFRKKKKFKHLNEHLKEI